MRHDKAARGNGFTPPRDGVQFHQGQRMAERLAVAFGDQAPGRRRERALQSDDLVLVVQDDPDIVRGQDGRATGQIRPAEDNQQRPQPSPLRPPPRQASDRKQETGGKQDGQRRIEAIADQDAGHQRQRGEDKGSFHSDVEAPSSMTPDRESPPNDYRFATILRGATSKKFLPKAGDAHYFPPRI